jgi:hypothetical protein
VAGGPSSVFLASRCGFAFCDFLRGVWHNACEIREVSAADLPKSAVGLPTDVAIGCRFQRNDCSSSQNRRTRIMVFAYFVVFGDFTKTARKLLV